MCALLSEGNGEDEDGPAWFYFQTVQASLIKKAQQCVLGTKLRIQYGCFTECVAGMMASA